MPGQRARYRKTNVHEADEEGIFTALIESLPANGRFVSIGSAIGYYPILAKRLSPDLVIHAVEPLPVHRTYFLENIELNCLQPDDFVVHPNAISSSEGSQTFVEARYGSRIVNQRRALTLLTMWVKRLIKRPKAGNGGGKWPIASEIRTVTLDYLIRDVGGYADLLQMDVQGLEADILAGGVDALRSGSVATFLIGTHGARIHRRCVGFLREQDYLIEVSRKRAVDQPDGIIVASKGVKRLGG